MSHLVTSQVSRMQALVPSRTAWISPQEQLEQLISSATKKEGDISGSIPVEWYTALKEIDRLPLKIPQLPNNLFDILNQPCPNEICEQKKPDGNPYTLGEKCTLMLVPQELGTINEFEKVVTSYGERKYRGSKNPLQLRYIVDAKKHGNVPFGSTHWVLHTNGALENSLYKSYEERKELVDLFAKKTFIKWQIPNFRDTIATIFLKKIATGKNLYPEGNDQNQQVTYTQVAEGVTIGGFDEDSLKVNSVEDTCLEEYERTGIAAQRILQS